LEVGLQVKYSYKGDNPPEFIIQSFTRRRTIISRLRQGYWSTHQFGECLEKLIHTPEIFCYWVLGTILIIADLLKVGNILKLRPIHRGVNTFFKTLAKLASSPVFLLTKTENRWPKI
jgi:hypothetical protein